MYSRTNPLKILSLGWGVQSWTLAAMAALGEIPMPDYAVHADTTHEMAGTYAHAEKWTPWLEEHGVKVRTVRGTRTDFLVENTNSQTVLIPAFTKHLNSTASGQLRRQCTNEWKIQPIRRFARTIIPHPKPEAVQMMIGISLDEWTRMRTSNVKYIVNQYPLVDRRINRAGCVAWLQANSLEVPGKSACSFCPYHSASAWQIIKRAGGADWDHAVAVDDALRFRASDYETFVHRHAMPLEEAVRIPEDYGAKQMEMDIPCDSGHCFV